MQLREMLFGQTEITGLFCFENRKEIFEGVHRSFKFVVLSFEKGRRTTSFPAAFMRHEADELDRFPQEGAIYIPVELIRRLSRDSLSIMEFKSPVDIAIAEKMFAYPSLDDVSRWRPDFHREFHMTDDAPLFRQEPGNGRLPLYEGKMIWHFDHTFAEPRYWIVEREGRKALLGKEPENHQTLGYQTYRLVFRDVAASTNERTMISTVLPPGRFTGNTLVNSTSSSDGRELLYTSAILNSFAVDFVLRQKVTNHCNIFYVYQVPVPCLSAEDAVFGQLVDRAARLICTTPEFDALAQKVGLKSHKDGVTDRDARAKLRAELDGLVAHLYGLTEEEFAHILATFPIVEQSVKDAALAAYRRFAPKPLDKQIAAFLAAGESATVEFKSSARWDRKENRPNKVLEQVIVKTIAAFLNSEGGTLLIGVDDGRKPVGLVDDYKTLGKRQDRDGYENWLTTLLLDSLGKETSLLIRTKFCELGGCDVCMVEASSSPKPAYLKEANAENLYIRTGNSTRLLTSREAVEYVKQHWK